MNACECCGLEIRDGEVGVRYMGNCQAHQEYRCREVLREWAELAEAECARLRAKIERLEKLCERAGNKMPGPDCDCLYGATCLHCMSWRKLKEDLEAAGRGEG